MERLLPSDPASVGGHRLVGRLGAGGMGVVYLARSPHGAWVALKVIREEYAEDPGFLARFRRETELASRLSSRWTVPVLTADADARSPWLATAYVPGLPLSEALGLRGPWPSAQVRALGAALAAALDDVHRAGLVHRDVKPANVLLAADGPRLIDFGIARAVGATALTTDGSVIGSPGYLSPEQARGTPVGAPSDVFSLGCVLAHTATGRPPFGTGGAATVLYRTVNEEPDLTGLPHELDVTLRACLAKESSARPTVAQLRASFGEFSTHSWLPEGLPALVADRAATVLDLPVPEPTALSFADSPPTDAPPSPSRRRLLVASAAVGVSAIGGGTAWWRWGRSGTPPGAGKPTLPRRVIGLLGDLSTAEVRSQQLGAQLAVAQHNARADRAFDLALRAVDDGGTAAGSAAGAARFVADTDVHAVIGAGGNAAVPAAVPVCTEAGLTLLVTRADTEDLTAVNATSALVLRSTRTSGPGSVLRYLNRVIKPTRSVVVHDLTDDEETLPIVRMVTVYGKLDGTVDQLDVAAADDFTAVAQNVASHSYDAMIFAGATPARAAACARALNDAGYRGVRGADEHILSTPFLKAGDGWWISTGYCAAATDPRTRSFATAYRARHRTAPPPWAAEAYDAVRYAAHGLAAQEGTGRESLRAELLRAPWQGITRRFSYESQSQYLQTDKDGGWFLYQVADGRLRFAARHDDIRKGV
ncbi:bifunctional serine/threonine-protein kinase/ABC transporter substrate-binding protein [Streptomyces pseudovenezuelae]|uniref:ABC-type branched-subunit amino acid transport system substrate-binding protein n=1 Tax=Streptomyces pseudovenezuelae TaxID=67350 RepID=A0ABT6LF30_9ACTN|nr:bifunctional serine/threonine-protein kinase/ABC transporter substrate-binding protein [Streptomyces pseudovenezuelae]MDH6214211.1 ABC-type branched-subunit amino acid transport system substrate-binding protein [Streptomyces pseudovenezuelae]